MADVAITAGGAQATPLDYVIPGAQVIAPKAINATFDGAAAATAFVPTLQFVAPNGAILASCPVSTPVVAGGSASVSWFPRGGVSAAVAASSITKVADITLVTNGVFNVPLAFAVGFSFLEAHIWVKVPTGTYGGVPPVVRARFMSPGAVLNKWRLLAAGSFANISIAGGDSSSAVGFAPQLPNTAPQQAAYAYTRVTWFNYQSQVGYKQWISDGMTFDQTFTAGGANNFVNRWTGAGWLESDGYPGLTGAINLRVYPNNNPTTTAGDPDAGRFAPGSRLLVLGYTA